MNEKQRILQLENENRQIKAQLQQLLNELDANKVRLNELQVLNGIDSLTKLYNRNAFIEKACHFFQFNSNKPAAFCFLDLDNFKQLNDNFGHQYGDEVLCEVARIIRDSIRSADLAGRYGGDEFLILLIGMERKEMAKKRIQQICDMVAVMNTKLPLTVSAGVVFYPSDGVSFQDLLEKSDQALYHSKNEGKNRITFL